MTADGARTRTRWLTRNVVAIGLLSLTSDMSHELVTAVLPLFLASVGGGTAALGAIEGVSDAASSLLKLWMSVHSDRVGRRKPVLVAGYCLTALLALLAFATTWWEILVLRAVAWIGRGARGPVRDALLSESVPADAHGRAFGFQGAMDTTGAVVGPLLALALISVMTLRHIILIAFIPGVASILVALFGVHDLRRTPEHTLRIGIALRRLPPRFWRFAAAVGVFGLGNFAHTLLVLRAVTMLTPHYGITRAREIAVALYVFHNVIYAAASYPAGWIGDHRSKTALLAAGYALFGAMCIGFVALPAGVVALVLLFGCAGIYIAIVDAMERARAADLLPAEQRGTGFGALATVNALGDLCSSIAVGALWSSVSVTAGFGYAALFTLAGAGALLFTRNRRPIGA